MTTVEPTPVEQTPQQVEVVEIKNKDLSEKADQDVSEVVPSDIVSSAGEASLEPTRRKIKVRHAKKDDGIFETGLDVIEHEFELEEDMQGNLQQIRLLYRDGRLTEDQMQELILKHLKQQKIFGFGSYDEFFGDYFKRDLVAVEDLNRVRLVQQARKQYERRWSKR